MNRPSPPKGVIFDLGDVLLTWSANTSTKIPAKMMRDILSSPTWAEYERGSIEKGTCYNQVAKDLSIAASEVTEAFSQARDSLRPNDTMVSFIHDIKSKTRGAIKIFAMSNMSKEDFASISNKTIDWSIFDRIFISGHAGMRKPDLVFYRYVLQKIKLSPEETVFIDDKPENILAARSLGIPSVVFDDVTTVVHTLRTILYDPVGMAFQFLYRQAQRFDSITDTGVDVPDNFALLLILEGMQDQ